MTRARTALAVLAVLGFGLASCGRDGKTDPAQKPDVGGGEDRQAFHQRVHREAAGRVLGLGETLFALEDPIPLRATPDAPWHAPPVSPGRIKALRQALDPAVVEARGVDVESLEAARRMLVQAVRFGLDRVNDRTGRHPPERSDPLWYPAEARRFLDEMALTVARGPCPGCADGLRDLASELQAAWDGLGAASEPAMDAVAPALADLKERLRRLPDQAARPADVPADAVQAAVEAVEAMEASLAPRRKAMGSAPRKQWGDPLTVSPETPAVLPARLSPEDLERRLYVEEHVTRPASKLFDGLIQTAARTGAMLEAGAEKKPPGSSGSAAPLTEARCKPVADALAAHTRDLPQFQGVAPPDCKALVRLAGDRVMSDGEAALFVTEQGFTRPSRDHRRANEAKVLARLTGRTAPFSHGLAQGSALLSGIDHPSGKEVAVARMRDAACLAATAVWIHARLGEDDALTQRLEKLCPARTAADWIAAAEADPRGSLAGLGLWMVGTGPAEVAALERFAWMPLGLVLPLARPEAAIQEDRPDPGLQVEVHPIDPEDLKEPAP